MKVSQLVAGLEGHQPDGHVIVSEIDAAPHNMFVAM